MRTAIRLIDGCGASYSQDMDKVEGLCGNLAETVDGDGLLRQ